LQGKEIIKAHQHFRLFSMSKSKNSGFEVADRPLRSPSCPYFVRFPPKKQKETSFVCQAKRGFFYNCGGWILTLGLRVIALRRLAVPEKYGGTVPIENMNTTTVRTASRIYPISAKAFSHHFPFHTRNQNK